MASLSGVTDAATSHDPHRRCHKSRTSRSPRSISRMSESGVVPIQSVMSVLFNVTRAATFTTESRGSPVTAAGRNVLAGIVASAVFEVMTATRTVANRLSL